MALSAAGFCLGVILGLMLITQPSATFVALTTFLGFYWVAGAGAGLCRPLDSMDMVAHQRPHRQRGRPFCLETSTRRGSYGPHRNFHYSRHSGMGHGCASDHWRFQGRWYRTFILGGINALVGILLSGSPVAAALAVPIVFGVLLLIQGAGLVMLVFRARA